MTGSWEQLRGHDAIRTLFERCLANDRLSHAWLLTGPDGVGKLQFARLLAKSLFCRNREPSTLTCCGDCRACRGFAAGTWPDYLEIGPPAGKSTIPLELLIGDAERRGREGLCYELSMTPQASHQRIAVINDAHRLAEAGANAILKTLEEPPAQSLILLICDHPDSLLPTIRSRCQVIRFRPLADRDVAAILQEQHLVESEAEAADVAALAEGSLSQAAQLMDPELRQVKDDVLQHLARLDQIAPLVLAARTARQLDSLSSGGDALRRNTQWLLRFVAQFVSDRVRRLASGDLSDPLAKRWGLRHGVDVLEPVLAAVTTASRRIDGNSPVPLVLEALFDEIARQLRQAATTAAP